MIDGGHDPEETAEHAETQALFFRRSLRSSRCLRRRPAARKARRCRRWSSCRWRRPISRPRAAATSSTCRSPSRRPTPTARGRPTSQSAEVYAITAPVTVPPLSDANLLKFGTKVGDRRGEGAARSEPDRRRRRPVGRSGSAGRARPRSGRARAGRGTAHARDADAGRRCRATRMRRRAPADARRRPAARAAAAVPLRTYVAFGTSTRGTQGTAVEARHRAARAAAAAAVGRRRSPTTKRRSR